MKKRKKKKEKIRKVEKSHDPIFPAYFKQKFLGLILILSAIIVGMSFFGFAGIAGEYFMKGTDYLIGKAVFAFPLFLVLGGMVSWEGLKIFRKRWWLPIFAIIVFILGLSGILGAFDPSLKYGGVIGYALSLFFVRFFGFWVALIIYMGLIVVGSLVVFYPLHREKMKEERLKAKEKKEEKTEEEKPSFIKREVLPRFKVKEISGIKPKIFSEEKKKEEQKEEMPQELEFKKKPIAKEDKKYIVPPFDLLETNSKAPKTGDLKTNAAIIKRTLQNFNIPVEMGEINIGPTVTQYTLKPAEGVKLSKITTLTNDLSLSLAAHPIRIEAPIPGKSLVGIEVPNTVRAKVRLRELIENPVFQGSSSKLTFILGRDVSGEASYADLARMPHMLVAGSTGSGKTVFLNNLLLSYLYRNSPEFLKLILIDPKRVEFPVYNGLPHLLAPVICNNNKAVNALRWLIEEMERRFDILSRAKSKDIVSYNDLVNNGKAKHLPYIILVIDELADLMAAKGREVESAIVRLAQMARAVGIHLVVATQRPSVEVITGLIKANITSRIAFQVASQVDSRTIFDMSGAERLLGRGDMLFTSAELPKPKRIQAALVTEKETKKVVRFINSNIDPAEIDNYEDLAESLKEKLEQEENGGFDVFSRGEDPLFETAKKVVVESNKASASLLQRRLQVGYARAARLMDMLEEKGIVGPADGAKPREVFGDIPDSFSQEEKDDIVEEDDIEDEEDFEDEEE